VITIAAKRAAKEAFMSIATMMALNIQNQLPAVATAPVGAGGGTTKGLPSGGTPQEALDSAMEKITAFIPSEVIGSYVAVLGIVAPQSDRGKWAIFGIGVLLIPLFMWLGYLTKKKQLAGSSPTTSLSKVKTNAAILFVFALLAFVVWAAALPGTPFLSISQHATAIGGACVIVVTGIMYKIADVLDLVP
jgi:hypothetical protein